MNQGLRFGADLPVGVGIAGEGGWVVVPILALGPRFYLGSDFLRSPATIWDRSTNAQELTSWLHVGPAALYASPSDGCNALGSHFRECRTPSCCGERFPFR